jgi:hypothetical protein
MTVNARETSIACIVLLIVGALTWTLTFQTTGCTASENEQAQDQLLQAEIVATLAIRVLDRLAEHPDVDQEKLEEIRQFLVDFRAGAEIGRESLADVHALLIDLEERHDQEIVVAPGDGDTPAQAAGPDPPSSVSGPSQP